MQKDKTEITLDEILATTPAEQVIARIEELDPPWKKDLFPWKIARPGEPIPWQAVYILKWTGEVSPETMEWAEKRYLELKASGAIR